MKELKVIKPARSSVKKSDLAKALTDYGYVLRRNPDSDILHVFEAKRDIFGTIKVQGKTCCDALSKADTADSNYDFFDDDQALLLKCVSIGKQVCGNCVRHFFGVDQHG